jgi:glycosyltransferase involved in cell wall biosynthesis
MKFCFILTQDLESPSGLGRYYPWGKELNKLGYEVEIIALHGNFKDLNGKFINFQKDFSVHYVSQMHVLKTGNTKKYFHSFKLLWIVILATIRLTYFSGKSNADIFIVGKPHPMNGIPSLFLKIIKRKKIIVDCDDDETHSGNFGKSWQKLVIKFFERQIPRIADLVTTNTRFTKDRIIRDGIAKEKIFYLTNGVDPERFTNIDEKRLFTLRKEFDLEDKIVMAYIGSMSLANHAINLLIDAFEEILKENRDIVMLLVGGGEDFDYIQNLVNQKGIQPNTVITGKVPSDDVKYYYKLADITIDPVKDDIAAKARSPLKIFESWACGVPVVTLPIGDRKELIKNDKNGYLFDDLTHFFNFFIIKKNYLIIKNSQFSENCITSAKSFYWNSLIINFFEKLEF